MTRTDTISTQSASMQSHPAQAHPAQADPRWQQVVARDASADGTFVYAVRSTGVYCRPSCPSRRANPANVSFHDSPAQAEAAGFRPCRRCHPRGQSPAEATAAIIAEACRLIEAAEDIPNLEQLADRIGLSPWHFHRQFRKITGLTPRQWAAAHRARKLQGELGDRAATVTGAIYDAGFNSNSRFYEQSQGRLGMTPSTWRKGGQDTEIRFAVAQCALGAILVAESARGICAISLGDDPEPLVRELQDRFPRANLIGDDPDFDARVAQVVGFVEAPGIGLALPLDIQGTAFQERVWQALRQIPAGQSASYADIAKAIGAPRAVRAVAGACAANRIAVAIPCHRILRTDGSLSGYRWGVARKRALLEREVEA